MSSKEKKSKPKSSKKDAPKETEKSMKSTKSLKSQKSLKSTKSNKSVVVFNLTTFLSVCLRIHTWKTQGTRIDCSSFNINSQLSKIISFSK